jgi:cysteine desulfurase
MRQLIYADHAATTPLDSAVFEAMTPWLFEEYGNASQPYSFARKSKRTLAEARTTIVECIGALPEEIYFTSGGMESDNWAVKGSAFGDQQYCTTITSAFEHHAILRACKTIEKLHWLVIYMQPTTNGQILPEVLEDCITDHTRLVSVMYTNNEIGTIQPVQDLCAIAHNHGAIFHTDAVQAVGHVKIDVQKLGVDMLSASAHKFNGPKEIGFLYIRNGTKIVSYADGGAQEQSLHAGTENIASIVGMAAALILNCDAMERNQQIISCLENRLIHQLGESGISYQRNGSSTKLPGLISLSFPGADGEAILHRMDLMGISISTGSACDSTNTAISHVLQAIKLNETFSKGTIRISLGKRNTEEEVDQIATALIKILEP